MKPLALDTPLSIEQRWIAGLRDKGALWRLRKLVDLTSLCWHATSGAFQRARPEATSTEQQAWLLRERYGNDLAQRVMERCHSRGLHKEAGMTTNRELWDALFPVVEALVVLGVPYYVGGSVASSVTGVARATLAVDLVVALSLQHAAPLAAALSQHYYADVDMIQHAIRRCSSFNVIHLASMFKIDVFVSEDTPFARSNMQRRVALEVSEVGLTLYFCAPEDIVLHKLLWYRAGSGVSDRQWYDLQGVLRLQAQRLDFAYSSVGRPNWGLPHSCAVLWMRLVWKAADVPACRLHGVPDSRTCTSHTDDIQFQHGCGHTNNIHARRRWSVEGGYAHGRLSPSGNF